MKETSQSHTNRGGARKIATVGADASDEGANYSGTRALKPDRS